VLGRSAIEREREREREEIFGIKIEAVGAPARIRINQYFYLRPLPYTRIFCSY
jgi:hypothetical protein